jgi:hypothetical protein
MLIGGVSGAWTQSEGQLESDVRPRDASPESLEPAANNAVKARMPATPLRLVAEEADDAPVDGIVVPSTASNFMKKELGENPLCKMLAARKSGW